MSQNSNNSSAGGGTIYFGNICSVCGAAYGANTTHFCQGLVATQGSNSLANWNSQWISTTDLGRLQADVAGLKTEIAVLVGIVRELRDALNGPVSVTCSCGWTTATHPTLKVAKDALQRHHDAVHALPPLSSGPVDRHRPLKIAPVAGLNDPEGWPSDEDLLSD